MGWRFWGENLKKGMGHWVGGLLFCLLVLTGCSTTEAAPSPDLLSDRPPLTTSSLMEVSPPATVLALGERLARYQPQVAILSPQSGEVVRDRRVAVRLSVRDLPLFKEETLGMGPHLHLWLDNGERRSLYNLDEPVILENLSPGTHTLRLFAATPWHESFKNEGAYTQTTFHVYAPTEAGAPDPQLPVLTYNQPMGRSGAEPVLLDFYLRNAPLHIHEGEDWRIRVTINGESFVMDRWEPVYLKGFQPGENWVKLQYIDGQGQPVVNGLNEMVQVVTYEPGGKDPLSRLMRDELPLAQALGMVNPGYEPPPLLETPLPPQPEPLPVPTAETVIPATPTPEIAPEGTTREPETVPAEEVPTVQPEEMVLPGEEVPEASAIAEPEEETSPATTEERDGQEVDGDLHPEESDAPAVTEPEKAAIGDQNARNDQQANDANDQNAEELPPSPPKVNPLLVP